MNEQQVEQAIQAKGLTAPRITPELIDAAIKSEHYFTATQGCIGNFEENIPHELDYLTFCVLVLKNGYTVTGESACASPKNFNAELGQQIAKQNARDKIWALEGYLLRDRLNNQITKPEICPHAAPFNYCPSCVANPCPVGLDK